MLAMDSRAAKRILLALAQALQGACELGHQLGPERVMVGLLRLLHVIQRDRERRNGLLPIRATQPVDDDPSGDREQPRLHRAPGRVEAVPGAPGTDKDVGGDVVGLVAVRHPATHEAPDGIQVVGVDGGEVGVLRAVGVLPDVGGGHP